MKNKALLSACFIGATALLAACGNSGSGNNAGTGAGTGTGAATGGGTSELATAERRFDVEIPGFPLAEPMNVSILGRHVGIADWQDMPFWLAIEEATNMNFTFTTPPNDDFLTNLNLAFASGNLPDILFGAALSAQMQIEHGSVGTLVPLQDLIRENAPNIEKLLNDNPGIRNSITAPDGNIYALPTINQSFDAIWPVGPVYYNGIWMEALNAEIPTTLDEFTALMFRFRDEMPGILGVDTVFPMSATDNFVWLRTWMLSFFGMTSRLSEAFGDEIVFNATTDNYRAFLEWMNMAFTEGLIHPEMYTLSGDVQNALGRENLIGFFQAWHSHHLMGTDEEQAMDNPMLRPIRSEWSPEGVLPRSPGISIGQFAITSGAQDPAALVRMIDFFYGPEGSMFAAQGPEGYLWVYDTHETGEQVRVIAPGIDPEDGNRGGRFTPYFGFPAPQLIIADAPRILISLDEPIEFAFNEFLKEETLSTMGVYGKVAIPNVMLTAEEANFISLMNADINIEIDRMEAQFITGITPINDETWAQFQETLRVIGVEDIRSTWQAAYDRWLEAGQN